MNEVLAPDPLAEPTPEYNPNNVGGEAAEPEPSVEPAEPEETREEPEPEPEPEPVKDRNRDYVVLSETAPGTWALLDKARARNANAAVLQVYREMDDCSRLTLVAVPSRSFVPIQVSTRPRPDEITVGPLDV